MDGPTNAPAVSDVAIVGGGPAGLSAALFTANDGLETVVFDGDGTWVHEAHGAAAALHIRSKERGEHVHDFDTPADAADTFGGGNDE